MKCRECGFESEDVTKFVKACRCRRPPMICKSCWEKKKGKKRAVE